MSTKSPPSYRRALPSARHLFDIPDDIAYFNCAYISPILQKSSLAGQDGVKRKAQPWTITADDFFSESEKIRRLFATLIDADSDDIAITPSASYGLATAARNLPLKAGENILILADQFPSNVYVWQDLADRNGATVITVPRPADGNWTAAILHAATPTTRIFALPHCHWTDGSIVDLVAIRALCDAQNAALVIDGTQSLGALPFSVKDIRPDFVATAAYKWLLGPYSLGFLYVAPKWQNGHALEQNWITRHGSENLSRLIDYTDQYQPGARRFDMGERSNFALLPVSITALEQILDWTVPDISRTLGTITQRIADALPMIDRTAYQAPHYLTVPLTKHDPHALLNALSDEKIFVSLRGQSLRITPHLYISDHDIDRLITTLAQHLSQHLR